LRLSAIYAALDSSSIIGSNHLQAALAVWEYCSAGASLLFGTSTGDPTADRIKEALNASSDGLSRKQINALFHGHLSSDRIEAALEQLLSLGVLTRHIESTRGRHSTLWSVIARPESMDEELIHQQTPQEERAQEDGS
jgi:hypothetical protein